MGDSFTEAAGVEYEDSFIYKLESLFRQNGRDIEILNAGVSSLSPSLEYRKLKQYLETGFTADEVVLMLDISDVEDEGVIYFDWEDLGWRKNPQRVDLHPPKVDLYPRLLELFQKSFQLLFSSNSDSNKDPWANRGGWTEFDSIFNDWVDRGVKRCQEYILKISELCQQHSISFSLVIYPWPHQLRSNTRPSKQEAIFSDFAKANNIDLYDLFPIFFALDNWEDYYVSGDVHWNEHGHTVVADFLYSPLNPRIR